MPVYQSSQFELDFSRNVILIDTGVVYAAFSERDQRKESAQAFLALWDGDILISASVVVETWGLLVGRDRDWDRGIEFIEWMQKLGNRVFLLPQEVDQFHAVYSIMTTVHISVVDSFNANTAHRITNECAMKPFLTIATYDFGDYLKARQKCSAHLNLIDPDSFDIYPQDYAD